MPRFRLTTEADVLALSDSLSFQKPLFVDFAAASLLHRINYGGKKELLLKAIKHKPGLQVWDCTAGLGVDSFLMASAGCRVKMFERSVVLAMLLEDGLQRGSLNVDVSGFVARMTLHAGDAVDALKSDMALPDVIYIDPMFPHRKKSANVKGPMQILQRYLGVDQDASVLLNLALASDCPRIVVKRPANGGELERKPDLRFSAKANRFDIFLNR